MPRLIGICLVVALIALTATGCRSSKTQEEPVTGQNGEGRNVLTVPTSEPIELPPGQKVVELAPPKEVEVTAVPEVVFSDKIRATCKVGVGEAFPAILGLPETLGKKLTVVAFVAPGTKPMSQMRAREILDDLQSLHEANRTGGMNVLIAHVEDGPKPEVSADLTLFSDTDGKLFGTVATDARPPRLFLLDSTGKVVWMDVEYSNTTRERLRHTVELLMKTP